MALSPIERCVNLLAYADDRRGTGFTLEDVFANVPGYTETTEFGPLSPKHRADEADDTDDERSGSAEDRERERRRKQLQRDFRDIAELWKIDVAFNETDQRYQILDPFFTSDERRALVSAAGIIELEGFRPDDPAGIGQAIGDDRAQIKLQIDTLFRSLRDAIEDRVPVTIRYDRDDHDRVIEPWAIGRWRSHWYVAAGDPAHDHALRRFRLDRIDISDNGGELPHAGSPGAYELPDDLDLEETFDLDPNAWGPDAPVDVTVRVATDHEYAFTQEFDPTTVERLPDHVLAVVTVRHRFAFVRRILAFGGQAVVVGPPEVRAEIRDHLARTAGAR